VGAVANSGSSIPIPGVDHRRLADEMSSFLPSAMVAVLLESASLDRWCTCADRRPARRGASAEGSMARSRVEDGYKTLREIRVYGGGARVSRPRTTIADLQSGGSYRDGRPRKEPWGMWGRWSPRNNITTHIDEFARDLTKVRVRLFEGPGAGAVAVRGQGERPELSEVVGLQGPVAGCGEQPPLGAARADAVTDT